MKTAEAHIKEKLGSSFGNSNIYISDKETLINAFISFAEKAFYAGRTAGDYADHPYYSYKTFQDYLDGNKEFSL